jgi:EmrB/QacA subfamily drug resistance transporter
VLNAYCDIATARCPRAKSGAAHPQLVLVTSILASSLAFVDGSVITVALPAIGRSFAADSAALQWSINAYLLPLSAMLLLGGAAGDRFGMRRVLMLGTAGFALASLACALAPSLAALLVARFCQGIAAAMLMPNSLAILGRTFSGAREAQQIGIWAAASSIAGAVGPVLGGWFIDLGSWRAIFLINLPLAVAALLLAWRFVDRDSPQDESPLDVSGAVLATAGLGALTWALTVASGQGWSYSAILAAIAGAALLSAFPAVERRRGERALVPLQLFTSAGFIGLSVLTLLIYGAFGALLVLLPYLLIEACAYSATAAGAALLPMPIILAVLSPLAGMLAGRVGSRLLLGTGGLVTAVGLLLMLRIGGHADYWRDILPAVLVLSLGLSAVAAPLTNAVLNSADARHTGAASGLNSALARIGGLIATAVLGAVLASRGQALLSSFHGAMVVAAIACVIGSLCAFGLVKA